MSWDNYSSDPSFVQKHRTIPVISSSSSDSLESSPTTLPEITITPASFTPSSTKSVVKSAKMTDIMEKNKSLLKAMNSVEVRIDSFPVEQMTADRLSNYHHDLQDIKEKFFLFSDEVLAYSMESLNTSDPLPKNQQGQELSYQYWLDTQTTLQQKMNNHQLEIRQAATDLAANKCLTEFEKQSLDIQKQQLQLQEKREDKAEQVEKEKANAVAEAKYDEILAASTELEEYLDRVADWSKGTRAEIMSAMQCLDKWSERYQAMNKAYRE